MKTTVWPLGGLQLHGFAQGEGAPLLLVHGSLCDCRYWSAQLPVLAESFRVLAPSLRGYYPNASAHDAAAPFSTEWHVADLIELIEENGEPAHLLGHSRGGNIALRIAAQRPDLVRSLILADPGGDYEEALFTQAGLPVPESADARNDFRRQALAFIQAGDVETGLALFIDTVSGVGIWQRSSARFRQMALDNAHTLLAQVADLPAPIDRACLAQVCCPTLLLGGERSPEPFPHVLNMLAYWLTHTEQHRFAGVSHGMNLQRPALFNRLVTEFARQY